MTPRSIRRAAERKAAKEARKAAAHSPATEPSPDRLAANRANAQLSTGPRTSEGKARVSLNAVKTGLTGRTVLLPTDDAAAYQTHLDSYQTQFAPEGLEERALVQSLADIRWRLNRITRLEMAIYARGHLEFADSFEDHSPAERPALIELETYLTYEKPIRNLQLQEARLARRYEKDLKELRRLQDHRKQEAAAAPLSKPLTNSAPAPFGFEFSNDLFDHSEPSSAPTCGPISVAA